MFVLAPLSHLSVVLCAILIVSKHPNIVLWDRSDNRWQAGKVARLFLDHQIVISAQCRGQATQNISNIINNSQSALRSNLILLLALGVFCLQIVKLGLEDIADQVAKLDLHLLPA